MGKDKTQTQTQKIDPASERHINAMRGMGRNAAESTLNDSGSYFLGADDRSIDDIIAPFLNPYQSQVVDATRGEFDHMRSGVRRDVSQAATRAGAFNSSRHGVAEGERLGAIDRAQGSQIAGLLSSGFQNAVNAGIPYAQQQRALQQQKMQEPLFRRQMAQQFMQGSYGGPISQTNTQVQKGNLWGDIAGAAMMGAGAFMGGPAGMAAAGSLSGANRGPGPARMTYMDDLNRPNLGWG